ncbi:non-ribosomal peptide synthetase [Gynuella sunshinyii]|uniref:Non-ribosomal peptide synthetase modules-related protein n=1 Tax=Gynuella sunshinyii YC6258 TaxID=1445510 RepID=A0A0C5V3T7_9GAMM|nr:non-ribosomal peptide synthetase [Gynuella sunshinyii]AJQ94155.1 non-ribosomal peptide synthetase modules-related protein [Gynuella sunshinyii YC6258]
MNKISLFEALHAKGIKLQLDDNLNLKVRGKQENLDPRLLQTLRDHKADIVRWLQEEQAASTPAIVAVDRHQPLPASFAQQRLWFIDQMEQDSRHFHIPGGLQIQGAFDETVAEQALQRIVDRHEPLRTVFQESDQYPLQIIRTDVSFTLECHDLSSIENRADQDARVSEILQAALSRPFDLSRDLMIRASCIRLSEQSRILFFNLHHIAADGWSMAVIFREFMAQYQTIATAAADPLPPLKVQYADYAVWQRDFMTARGTGYQQQLNYWQQQLQGLPQLHSLPTDFSRPRQQSFNGRIHRVSLPAALQQQLEQLAAAHDCTLFVLLHSAFSLLLNAYADDSDIVVGTPVANRLHSELKDLVGFFVNTLVLRTDAGFEGRFSDYLAYVRQVNIDAQANQEIPFEHLVEVLNPPRSTSHAPLFQILFSLNNNDRTDADMSALVCSPLDLRAQHADAVVAQYDLSLQVQHNADELGFEFEYNTDLFSTARIEGMAQHFVHLLHGIVADPQTSVSQLSLLSAAEQAAQLSRLNHRRDEPVDAVCLHQLFEIQADRTPDQIALSYGNRQLSYREVNDLSHRLAGYLVNRGIGNQSLVGVCLEPSPELIIALLAVWKAGAAYVPLDPAYPAERIDFMVQDSGVALVLSQPQLQHLNFAAGVERVDLDEPWFAAQTTLDWQPARPCRDDDLAYVIYTSGSTGQPKGVMVEHRAVVNFVHGLTGVLPPVPGNTWLLVTSLSFDIALFEWFGCLVTGGRCVIASAAQQADAFALKALLETEKPGLIQTTPSRWSQLLDAGWRNNARVITLCGGEPLTRSVEQRLSDNALSFWNCYGPTEATIWSLVNEIRQSHSERRRFSLGYSLANYQHLVLSPSLTMVPDGSIGELYIGGDSLARGYLNRPELTEERFIANPFADQDPHNPRLYRTGDLVRYHANGELEFIGRVDDQIKLHGFRIELGEIEAQLLAVPAVQAAVAVVRESANGLRQLLAYVVAPNAPEPAQLREHLRATLPDYMVPGRIITLEALPLTPNGKVDKKALPQPEVDTAGQAFVAPETALQQQLAAIWAELLGIDAAGISLHHHFFELGGHSLLSVRLVTAMRETLGVELSVRDIFNYPVLADFATFAAQCQPGAVRRAVTPVAAGQADYPASFAQQRLWVIDQMAGDSRHYNMPGGLRVQGHFNADHAEAALQAIVERHESLRTSFHHDDGQTRQIIHPAAGFELERLDVSGQSEEVQEQAIRAEAIRQVETPFDLTAGLLIRAVYIHQAEARGVLIFNLHHIASDGWSMGILIDEFVQLYEAIASQQPQPLSPLPIQYKDYACWQHDFLYGDDEADIALRQQQLSYWQQQLQDAPPVHELPLDKPRPAQQDFSGAHYGFQLDQQHSEHLLQYARSKGLTPFMVLHGALAMLLSRYSNQTDLVIGTVVSNRLQAELEPLVGFFVNTLALRSRCDGELTLDEFWQQLRQTDVEAQANQELPFDYLIESLNPPRNAAYSPLIQIMFNMNTHDRIQQEIEGLVFTPLENYEATAQFELTLDATETSQGLMFDFEYATALFEADTIARLADHFLRLLTVLPQCGEVSLKQLPILTDAEVTQQLETFNATRSDYPREQTIHQLVEASAARDPEATALEFGHDTLSYDELNRQANRLAHYLIAQGVQTDSLVGLCVERSVDMVVAMLAILKAGAAYVPLDPSYPLERLEYMQADSRIDWLLQQSGLTSLSAPHTVVLDDPAWQQQLQPYPDHNPDRPATARQLAYVIYTSGSTGQPKGVLVEHRSVVRLVCDSDYVQLTAADVVAQASNNSFDAATFEIWGALLNGAKLSYISKNDLLNPLALKRSLFGQQITTLFVTTALFNQVSQVAPDTFSRLRYCLFGGEAYDKSSIDRVIRRGKPEHLLHVYGPTENTTFSTCHPITTIADIYPIGTPIRQTQCYVLDQFQNLLPLGSVGELYVGGDGLARGYLNREELTAERFVAHPFVAGERLYRTGDLVRMDADGVIEYVGRVDAQVKIRGFRIELSEIEQHLLAMEAIKSAVVVAREDTPGQKRLVAYIVIDYDRFDEEDEEDEAFEGELIKEIRLRLSVALPAYMMPSFFVPIERLPLTVNGKIDTQSLPLPDSIASMGEYVAPGTETEQTLVDIWCELLQFNREDMSVAANFFELGGHSLLVVKQLVQIKAAFGLDLDIKVLFETESIASLGQHIDRLLEQQKLSQELSSLDQDNLEEMEF